MLYSIKPKYVLKFSNYQLLVFFKHREFECANCLSLNSNNQKKKLEVLNEKCVLKGRFLFPFFTPGLATPYLVFPGHDSESWAQPEVFFTDILSVRDGDLNSLQLKVRVESTIYS